MARLILVRDTSPSHLPLPMENRMLPRHSRAFHCLDTQERHSDEKMCVNQGTRARHAYLNLMWHWQSIHWECWLQASGQPARQHALADAEICHQLLWPLQQPQAAAVHSLQNMFRGRYHWLRCVKL